MIYFELSPLEDNFQDFNLPYSKDDGAGSVWKISSKLDNDLEENSFLEVFRFKLDSKYLKNPSSRIQSLPRVLIG